MKFITLACLALAPYAAAIKSNPLPAPQNITWGSDGPVFIDPSVKVVVHPPVPLVEEAFNRAIKSIISLKWVPAAVEEPISSFQPFPTDTAKSKRDKSPEVHEISIVIKNSDADLQAGVDESFEFNATSESIEITSETPWGALHALSTLNQIVFYDDEKDQYYLELSVEIVDWPNYSHRGVLIDSGRNFLTVSSILDQIDIMALAKFNVLHWHIVDSQSWPLSLEVYPEMVKDAYSKREIYTRDDLYYVIAYAKARGVRVVPEIDMPGHTRAGYLQLNTSVLACENSFWSNDVWAEHTAVEPPSGQLDILLNETYDVIKNIYDEVSKVFSDNFFHVGGDELHANCYNFSEATQKWYAEDPSRTPKDLNQYWVNNSVPIFKNTPNRKMVMWEDVVTSPEGAHNVPKDVVLQTWAAGLDTVQNLTAEGYDVIVTSSDYLYLDCGYGGWVTNDPRYVNVPDNEEFNTGLGGSWCAPYKTWQRIYSFDFTANLTDTQKAHVLGAEAAVWGEQTDSVVLVQKTWPRAAALAENLWSGNRDVATGNLRTNWMSQRILNFREFLVASGYAASPLVPKFCVKNPHACDLFRNQTIFDAYSQ